MSIYDALPLVHRETVEHADYTDHIDIKKVDINNPECAFTTIMVPSQPDTPMLMSQVDDVMGVWPRPQPLAMFLADRDEPLLDVEPVFTALCQRGIIPYDTTYAFVTWVTRDVKPVPVSFLPR